MRKATVSSPYLQVLLVGARRQGIDVDDLAARYNIDLDNLDDPERRIDRVTHHKLWDEISRRSGDDAFGLHLAEMLEPGAFAVIDYLARNSANVGEAYTRLTRFSRLVHDAAEVRFSVEEQTAQMSFVVEPYGDGSPRHAAEFVAGALLVLGRQMTGVAYNAVEVGFSHAAPPSTAEHRRLFGCAPRFDQNENYVMVDRTVLATPITDADPRLRGLLDRYAEELLAKLPTSDDLESRVRRLVAESLRDGDPTLEGVAKKLGMSPRTLQRRLKDDGTSHQELLDVMRRELAERYLKEPSIGIGETAFLLGFSEPSAFHRAFKRWTGTTPGAYRRKELMH